MTKMYIFEELSILALLLFGIAHSSSDKTDIVANKKNFAKAADRALKQLVKQYDLDPISKDTLDGQLSGLKYILNNVNISGLTKCKAIQLVFGSKETVWEEKLDCAKFVLEFDYTTDGSFAGKDVSGEKGHMVIKTGKVLITIIGSYREVTRHKKKYFEISNPTIEVEAQDKVVMESNESSTDKVKAEAVKLAFNGKAQTAAKKITEYIMNKMLTQYFNDLGDYLHNLPKEEAIKQ